MNAVAKYNTEVLNQSTTDLETSRDVIQPVTQFTDISTDSVLAQLIGVALMSGETFSLFNFDVHLLKGTTHEFRHKQKSFH